MEMLELMIPNLLERREYESTAGWIVKAGELFIMNIRRKK
jgi:hypothetical protein